MECIKGIWSVSELERQIQSLYFERSGLSKDKKKLSDLVNQKAVQLNPKDVFNNPETVEFLGLNDRAIVTESDLEQAILDNLQMFLLCTEKGNTMVKYATAGLDETIFVQKYMLALPSKEELEEYIRKEL